MKRLLPILCWSLAVVTVIWVLFSWPLPRYLCSGIPSSSLSVERGSVRTMIPGDHLQFLYQFWLAEDTLKGHTRPFFNPYEFNAGNDADRSFVGAYYSPFSLFYAVGSVIGGRAFGYNLDQLVTLWITFLFMWLLVRRYSHDDWLSAAAAVIGITVPYMWIVMLDGSPTGLGMMWIPVIFWSLDIMVAERKMWAGTVAGIGICLAESDTHVFFFTILASPFWCLFSFLFHFPGRRPSREDVLSILKASAFLIIFLGAAFLLALHVRHGLEHSMLAVSGRSPGEIRANSPSLAGVFKLQNAGETRKIYIGVYLAVLLLAGLGACLWARLKGGDTRTPPMLPVFLLCLGIAGVILLSTGPRNPAGPGAWKVVVKLIPPYAMIRQPHKIYCLMPVLLALAAGILWPYLFRGVSLRWKKVLAAVLLVPLVLDYNHRIRPTVCVLRQDQGAFRAIAEDAKAAGNPRPHLLSLPLWPGDSHYDSLNEYYVSLYRIRMVNGYSATVKKWFRDGIFLPFESMNVGGVSDAQLNSLQKMGIGYVILHEDCFPEKVSPFPVGHTLQALLNHPRLQCIGKDATVWAFRILDADRAETGREKVAFMKHLFPAKRREFERNAISPAARGNTDPTAVNGGLVTLSCAGASVRLPDTMATLETPLAWQVRARGRGKAAVSLVLDGVTNTPSLLELNSDEWLWQNVALASEAATRTVAAFFSWETGSVDLDSACLTAASWASPPPGGSIDLPAICFFHAGYTDRDLQGVILRKDCEPADAIFYGPGLPLDGGKYTAQLVCHSEAPVGTVLGEFGIRGRGDKEEDAVPLVAGQPAVIMFERKDNKPFCVAFRFGRAADLRIEGIHLIRIR